MRRALAICGLLLGSPALAMVGGAPVATEAGSAGRAVLIVGSRGNSCTGTAIARDLVLTAAHCVLPGADYKLVEFDAARRPRLKEVARIAHHPQFSLPALRAHRATADVALLKLAEPLPALSPAGIGAGGAVEPGDRFMVAGFGVTVRGDGRSGGILRSATLAATGRPGGLQLRLVDPAAGGDRPGLGACTGDSGAPVFDLRAGRPLLIGVVSWSTGPGNSAGCGGLTGVTPLVRYRDWIVDAARRMGSPLGNQ